MVEVLFDNDEGSTLAGRIEFPPEGPGSCPLVIFAHGFDSSKDSRRSIFVAARLRDVGIATFLFDFTGHGNSQGLKMDSTVTRQVEDLRSAVSFAREHEGVDPGRIGINGASSGGLVALLEALSDQRIKTLALRGPRTDGLIEHARQFKIPILIVQGEHDPLLTESKIFYEALPGEKQLKIIIGGNHLFSRLEYLQQVAEVTSEWFADKLSAKRDERAA